MFADCQAGIGGNPGLNCATCSINGRGKCDPAGCMKTLVYNKSTKTCEMCQRDIGGQDKQHCTSCNINGPGKSDNLNEGQLRK